MPKPESVTPPTEENMRIAERLALDILGTLPDPTRVIGIISHALQKTRSDAFNEAIDACFLVKRDGLIKTCSACMEAIDALKTQ